MSMPLMTITLFAGVRGYLDKIEVSDVGAFEDAWRKHVQSNHAGILEELTKEKAISDALETKLGSVCGDFVANFSA